MCCAMLKAKLLPNVLNKVYLLRKKYYFPKDYTTYDISIIDDAALIGNVYCGP